MNLGMQRRAEKRQRTAFSLLEMVMASTLLAGSLVPTLAAIRDAMAKSRDLSRRNLLSNYAVSILESKTALNMYTWSNSNTIGNFAIDGHPKVRFIEVSSDDPADGGIVNQLMHIQVTVFDDADGDSTLDSNELQVTFRTKIAKLESYENEE